MTDLGAHDPAPEPSAGSPPPRRPRRLILWAAVALVFFVVLGPVAAVTAYRFLPVPVTLLMIQRLAEGEGFDRRPVPLSKIDRDLVYAVIAAEDSRFCEHDGFDFEAIEEAWKANQRGRRLRGGSTLSQQTAKNVFLWPGRGWVRKGLEAYYTVLIEALWPKRRIVEVYLNAAEWGPGVYGAEAASRYWFGKSAEQLSPREAARLAAILPSPRKWKAAQPGRYVRSRSGRIVAASGTVRSEGLAACVYDR
jgi:monofunctional biosynthetic peptidoglycan transglycosylase